MTKEEMENQVINNVLARLDKEDKERLRKIRENSYKVWQDYSKKK